MSGKTIRVEPFQVGEASGIVGVTIPGLVVAIPCYNEETAIGSVVLRARQHAESVVVIDDGSTDGSARVAQLAGARVVQHAKNGGYGKALQTIFSLAKAEEWAMLVILDSDGQHNADDIPRVVEPVAAGRADIAVGSRFVDGGRAMDIPGYRRAGIKVLTAINNVGAAEGARISDGQSGFRAYSQRAIMSINPVESDMGISAEILLQARQADLKFEEVGIKVRYDVDGSSQNPVRHGLGVIGSMIRYVEVKHPLLFFGVSGLLLFIVGVGMGAFSLLSYLQTHDLPFGPTMGCAVLTVVGMVLGMTGLMLHAVINALRGR